MTTTLTASTTAQLNQGIATANAAIAGGFIIALQGNITETTQLHAIDLQSGVPLTIDGSNGSGGIYTLNGAGSRGFVVDAGSVIIQNLGLSNAVLSGGSSAATVTLAGGARGAVAVAGVARRRGGRGLRRGHLLVGLLRHHQPRPHPT